jgi:NAD(P)H-dependent FMN reductase
MTFQKPFSLLVISGSLRRASTNSAVVRAAARVAGAPIRVTIYEELGSIPAFNRDQDDQGAPEVVIRFRTALAASDAVLISSPEYAHGVPGVLKNALDWVVGSSELVDKPVALINTSPRATHAFASLTETLTVMSARVVPAASITLPLQGRMLDADGIVADAELSAALKWAVDTLVAAAREAVPF